MACRHGIHALYHAYKHACPHTFMHDRIHANRIAEGTSAHYEEEDTYQPMRRRILKPTAYMSKQVRTTSYSFSTKKKQFSTVSGIICPLRGEIYRHALTGAMRRRILTYAS
jgi:hypothetical protein